jgi:hypothetical protein
VSAEAREQYNVVPAQALMELFLAEEGGRSKGRVGDLWMVAKSDVPPKGWLKPYQ